MTNEERLLQMCKDADFDREEAVRLMKAENLNRVVGQYVGTYLLEAAVYANVSMVKLLLEHGADPNFFDENEGPPLWECMFCDEEFPEKKLSVAKLLLDYGANPVEVWDDEPLLDYVVWYLFNEGGWDADYRAQFLIYLVAYGASTNYCSPKVYEPIDKSCLNSYEFHMKKGRGKIMKDGKMVALV